MTRVNAFQNAVKQQQFYKIAAEFVIVDDKDEASSFSETLRVLVLYSRNKAKLNADRRQDHLTRLQAQLSTIQGQLNRRRYSSTMPVMEMSK